MVRHSASRTAPALALGALLLLTGCSADSSEKAEEAATTSPLEEYFGAFNESDPAEMAAEQTEIENAIASCMSDAGFEYIPRQVEESEYDWATQDVMADQNTKEWVAKNGYGMSMSEEDMESVEEAPEDPNMDYVTSLSPGAQTAYYEALNGPDVWSTMTEEEMANYEYKWEDAGCQGAADHEIRNAADLYSDPEHAALFESMQGLWETTTADPRTAALDVEWADCMADAGYTDFSKPQDALDKVMTDSNALWENVEIDEEDPEASTGPSDEARAEVRELELTIAMADFTCKEEVDYTEKTKEIQVELEEQFVKDHKAELDAFVAAVEKAEAE